MEYRRNDLRREQCDASIRMECLTGRRKLYGEPRGQRAYCSFARYASRRDRGVYVAVHDAAIHTLTRRHHNIWLLRCWKIGEYHSDREYGAGHSEGVQLGAELSEPIQSFNGNLLSIAEGEPCVAENIFYARTGSGDAGGRSETSRELYRDILSTKRYCLRRVLLPDTGGRFRFSEKNDAAEVSDCDVRLTLEVSRTSHLEIWYG